MTNRKAKSEPTDVASLPSSLTTDGASSSNSTFDPVDLESAIIQLCLQSPNGVSDRILELSFPTIAPQQRVSALNRLLSLNKIDLLKSTTPEGTSTFLCRIKDTTSSSSSILSGGDQMEKAVYQLVKESGQMGIWMRDIRIKTQLSQTFLNKTLKSLESKKLIKAVKSVHASKKKIYMLFDLTPDPSITGGNWYFGHEFESEFVQVLNEHCYRLLLDKFETTEHVNDPLIRKNSSYLSSNELVQLINESGISTVLLTVQDIESILYTLICDGKVEKTTIYSSNIDANKQTQNIYRAVKPMIESAAIVRVPCGICPVFRDCHDDGLITPKTCIYLNTWLDF
ncbi:unnamed protein product [Didymodactylos carnosus]|uniref:DNA-directed RNA polymerase III subunit RPC6 n=1 Tax=Didymodactylos carnosus TaxID=1234261 RepID=A0A813Z2A2_9BILA|nr:unnamed protein product [Didymodactylos carnosus]CAF0892162.1 unnamed protein product [Didymodactylos carnosus]CAF3497585.1 unnamed protein product [Didymodactylos carnosus]CAF3676207.1 unnamed protein product [Didymodactylos carnosus]